MKILIVDDIKKNLFFLETILKDSGFEVESAANGAEALEKLHANGFSMIISDILMPVMDGFQLCRKVKKNEELKNIPLIFYTATYTDKKDEEFALKIGAAKYIQKPAEPKELIKIIQDTIKDVEKDKIDPKKLKLDNEKEIFKLYSERLIHKLEKKMFDLEREITERKQVEELLNQQTHDLGERVKELNCLYEVDELARKKGLTLEEMLKKAVQLIPSSWQYPEITEGCITFEDKKYKTKNFKKTEWMQRADIIINNQKTGLIEVCYLEEKTKSYEGSFLKEERNLINAIAKRLEQTIEKKRAEEMLLKRTAKLRKALDGIIHTIALMVETRDPYTAGHQKTVASLASAVAKEMGLSKDQVEGILMAGTVHDLGKISVPAEILTKPTRLTENEFNLIKDHSQIGYDILKDVDFPWPIAQMVLQHHERMNGSGYPQGLQGKDILIEARILCVTDVIEAMSSHRPYRPALGMDKALAEISKNKDILYDPKVVDACLNLFKKKDFKLE